MRSCEPMPVSANHVPFFTLIEGVPNSWLAHDLSCRANAIQLPRISDSTFLHSSLHRRSTSCQLSVAAGRIRLVTYASRGYSRMSGGRTDFFQPTCCVQV